MSNRKENPEEQRERLRQKELRNNPLGTLGDGLNRASHPNFTDLFGGLGWIGTGILIVVLIVAYVLYKLLS